MWEIEKPKHADAEPPSLASALNFTDDELTLNRDGQLSTRQRDELLGMVHQYRSLEMLVSIIAGVVAVAVILDGVRRGDTVSSRIAILGVLGAVVYGLIFLIRRHMVRYRLDGEGVVGAVQGRVSLDVRGSGSSAAYTASVAGEIFYVDRDAFFAFKNGDPYALYYVPRTRQLLSAEWLRET